MIQPNQEVKVPAIVIRDRAEVPQISEEIDEFVYRSLTMRNPKWEENDRMMRWQGETPQNLYFYQVEDDRLFVPRGFIEDLVDFAKRQNVDLSIVDQKELKPKVDFGFMGELKPFQKPAVSAILIYDEGTLCSPTGSGKTVMALRIIAWRMQPTIIIVHTKELLDQWRQRIKSFLDVRESDIGIVGSGRKKEGPITVALIQTLRKHPEILGNYGHMVVDECHRVPSRTFTDTVRYFAGKYITGLSATPYRRDGLGKVIGWYAGPIRYKIDPKDLIEEGHIVGVEAIVRNTDFKYRGYDPAQEYHKLLKQLSEDKSRNQIIVEDILTEVANGETCLVLTDRKAHCDTIRRMLGVKTHVGVEVLTGNVPAFVRKRVVEQVNRGEIQVLIATGQLIGEGFDCKNLSTLFLALPIRFTGRIIQYLGRVLRPKPGKDRAKVYEYFDRTVFCLYGGHKARMRVYDSLKI